MKATFITGFWSNNQDSNVQTYLRNAAGNPTFGGVAGFASNYFTLSEKHLANAVSIKSDTRGFFDFDLSASRYDYLEDIQRNPYGVIAGTARLHSQWQDRAAGRHQLDQRRRERHLAAERRARSQFWLSCRSLFPQQSDLCDADLERRA